MMNLDKGQYFMMNEVGSRIWELIEGNTWNDTYWGVCNGVGKNTLGQLLMKIREEIRKGLSNE